MLLFFYNGINNFLGLRQLIKKSSHNWNELFPVPEKNTDIYAYFDRSSDLSQTTPVEEVPYRGFTTVVS